MNREEALNKAIGILTYHQVNSCKSKEAVANMNEIIEALEKIDQEQCGDCISRERVSGCVSTMYYKGLGKQKSLEYILKYVERLPSVSPQPKMGQWKRINKEKYVQHAMSYYRCSECGKEIIGTHNYCPNCGRKNEGGGRMTREDAIQYLAETDISPEHIMELVEALSSSENPNKWIPVSERLPEKNNVYLVAVNSFGCPTRDVDGFMAHTDRKWELYGNKVIAWMPLPEPYNSEIPTGSEGSDKE